MSDVIPFGSGRCVRTVAQDDWRACIEVRGELDLARAPELEYQLGRHLRAGRRLLRLDTSQLEFIDCAALDVIVRADDRCRRDRGSLILSGAPAHLRRLLAVLGLDAVLLVDYADALADPTDPRPVVGSVG